MSVLGTIRGTLSSLDVITNGALQEILGKIDAYEAGGKSDVFVLKDGLSGYRPRQWGMQPVQQMILCKTNVGGLFFDAVLKVTTDHSATITSHPVQAGANISDHMYMEPIKINMEIGMSDAMASMAFGQWSGAYTKSVSAYRMLVSLQESRTPFSVLTRLNKYDNMVIQSISVNDDANTLYGLRASISMQQIIMATVATEKISARAWSTASSTNKSEAQPVEKPTSEARRIEEGLGV